MVQFLSRLAADDGVTVVCEQALDKAVVNVHAKDQPLGDLLAAVARRAGADVTRVGDLWFLGQLRGEDRALLVGRCSRLGPTDLESLLHVYLSDTGRLAVTPEGIVVAGDTVEIDSKIAQVLADVNSAGGCVGGSFVRFRRCGVVLASIGLGWFVVFVFGCRVGQGCIGVGGWAWVDGVCCFERNARCVSAG